MEKGSIANHVKMKFQSLLICIFCSLSSFGQSAYREIFGDSIKEISWSCHIAYLPGAQSESVVLKADSSKLIVSYNCHERKKRVVVRRTQKIEFSKNDFVQLYKAYSLFNQRYVELPISGKDKDSLREFLKDTLYNGNRVYALDPVQLHKYLERDSIEIDMSVFAMDSVNDFLQATVLDGAPFCFSMTAISSGNDTTVHMYTGNLFGSKRYRDLSQYLLYNTLYNETTIYDKLPFNEYFSRSNFLRVVLRYIEGKEGLLEFRPFELYLKED